MEDLSNDKILQINPKTNEIFSFTDPTDVIAMKIFDNYCQFNIMNNYFRNFIQVIEEAKKHHGSYMHKRTEILRPLINKVYVIKQTSITKSLKYYIGYNINSNNTDIRLIIDTSNFTMAYENFDFKIGDDNDMFNQFTYTIYEPTNAVEEAYRNLLKIPTPEAIIDKATRVKHGNQAGLDAESLHMLKEYTKSQNPNVFGFFGGKRTQKKKSNKHKKTNKQK